MERLYLPPKVGNTLGAMTLLLAGYSLIQTADFYGRSQYMEGQSSILEEIGEQQAAAQTKNDSQLMMERSIGNGVITLGFMSISSLSFYWAGNGKHRNRF